MFHVSLHNLKSVFANCLHIKEHIDDIIETKLVVELHLTIHWPEFSVELPFCRNKEALCRASDSLPSILVTSRTPAYNTYTKSHIKQSFFARHWGILMWCHWHRIFVFNSRSYDAINDGIVSSTANTRHIQRHAKHAYFNWHWEIIWVIFDIEYLYSTADLMMPSMTLSSSDTDRNDLRVLYAFP